MIRTVRLLLLTALLLPSVLTAQRRASVSAYASTDDALSTARVGAVLGSESGGLGVRVSIAADAFPDRSRPISPWSADVDGTAHLGKLIPALSGIRLLGGVGMEREDATSTRFSMGAGGIYTRPIAGPLAWEAEVRYRVPFSEQYEPTVEVRAGITLAFVGARSTSAPVPSVSPPFPGSARPPFGAATAARVIETGDVYVGIPYRWGGNTPEEGFDCSGFLRYVFLRHGIELPRVSRDQAGVGEPLPTVIEALRPGDLMFFAGNGVHIDHAAMYVGNGRILHSSASGKGVRYDDLLGPRGRYYRTHFVAARRILSDDAAEGFGKTIVR